MLKSYEVVLILNLVIRLVQTMAGDKPMQAFTVVSNVFIHSLFGLIHPITVNHVYNKMYFIFLFKTIS